MEAGRHQDSSCRPSWGSEGRLSAQCPLQPGSRAWQAVSRRVLACTGLSPVCLPFPHRTLKGKLARQHPEAFSHIPEASLLEDEDEDPIPPSTTTTIATSEQSTGSCDTSPDTVSPSLSPGFEDLSHVRPSSPAINGRSHTDDEEMLGE